MESRRKIRVLYRKYGSIKGVSRISGVSIPTVRKIVKCEEPLSIKYKRSVQPYPKLDKYTDHLEKMLRDNRFVKPKRNGLMLFEELRFLGYEGSYCAVSRYIQQWKRRCIDASQRACVPLSFSPGEAFEFDWSYEKVVLGDELVAVKVAHFILCYSGKKFAYIYPNESQEMVFDAHVRAFKFFGGSPLRGIYDNMKTVVKKLLKGHEREWNSNFERLCAHYRFEPTACTPFRGNEKGRVERQVRIIRDQFFTPMPKASSLQELNDRLTSQIIHYNRTHMHPLYKDKTVDEVFTVEKTSLLAAPVLFEGYRQIDVKVSITCLAMVDRNSYSVHCTCSGKIVQCKVYADKVLFIYEGQGVGQHVRRFTKGQTYYDWQHYLPILAHKPGSLKNGSPFKDMPLPEELLFVQNRLSHHTQGIKDFAHILSYIPSQTMESVVKACQIAITSGTISKDAILNILLRQKDIFSEGPQPLESRLNFKFKHMPLDDCKHYNLLLKGV